jgi:hypothetical protein
LFVSLITAAAAVGCSKDGNLLEGTSAAAGHDNAPQGMQAPAPPPGTTPPAPGAPIDTANPNAPKANPAPNPSAPVAPGPGSGVGSGSGSGPGTPPRIPGDAGVPPSGDAGVPTRDAGRMPGDAR